jgi:hypothetical protein
MTPEAIRTPRRLPPLWYRLMAASASGGSLLLIAILYFIH